MHILTERTASRVSRGIAKVAGDAVEEKRSLIRDNGTTGDRKKLYGLLFSRAAKQISSFMEYSVSEEREETLSFVRR